MWIYEICFSFEVKKDTITSTDSITFIIEFDKEDFNNLDPAFAAAKAIPKEKKRIKDNTQIFLDPENDDIPDYFNPNPIVYKKDPKLVREGIITRLILCGTFFGGAAIYEGISVGFLSQIPNMLKNVISILSSSIPNAMRPFDKINPIGGPKVPNIPKILEIPNLPHAA